MERVIVSLPLMKKVSCATGVLVLTVFTAGLVDVLSFAKLGAIFTSAMTGNLALLGFYAATGAVHSAIKSLSALAGFIVGCAVGTLQSRHASDRAAVRRILGLETLAIVVCAIGSMQSSLSARSDFMQVEILLLAFAMGLQSIVGARLKQTNVVFTTTLIKIVSAAIGSAREQSSAGEISHLEVAPGSNREVLLAIHLIGDRGSVDTGTQVIAPEALAGLRIERVERAVAFAHEHEVSRRRQYPADQGLWGFVLPGDLAGLDIQRDEGTILNPIGRDVGERAAEANETGRALGRLGREAHQLVHRHDVQIVRFRRIRGWRPLGPAVGTRQHIHALARGRREHVLRHHDVGIGLADQLAGAPVEYEYPADLARLGGSRDHRAVLMHIEQHDVADGVVVPYIVLDLLVIPLECA